MDQHQGDPDEPHLLGWEQEYLLAQLLAVLDDPKHESALSSLALDLAGGFPGSEASPALNTLLTTQVARIARLMDASLCALYLAEQVPAPPRLRPGGGQGLLSFAPPPERQALRLRALHGALWNEAAARLGITAPPGSPAMRAFVAQRPLVSEVADLPALDQWAAARNVRRWLSVPLLPADALLGPEEAPTPSAFSGPLFSDTHRTNRQTRTAQRLLGVLAVGRREGAADFSEGDMRLLMVLGEELALAQAHQRQNERLSLARGLGQRYQTLTGASAELEQVLEGLSEGVLVLAPDGQVVRLNSSGRALLCWLERPEPAGAGGQDFWQQLSGAQVRSAAGEPLPQEQWPMARALRGEVFQGQEVRYAHSGCAERLLVFSGRPLAAGQGHPAILNFHPASEEQQARVQLELVARLADQRAHYIISVVEAMTDGVFVCDANGLLFLINSAGRRLLGATSERTPPGQRTLERLVAEMQARLPDGQPLAPTAFPLARALRGETVSNLELALTRPESGQEWRARVSAAPIKERADDAPIVGAVCVVVDITEARALDRAKDTFLAMAAHELKTPLTSIRGFAQLLRHGAREAPQGQERRSNMQWVDKIEAQTDRMLRLVEEMNSAARADLGKLELKLRPVALGGLLRRVAEAQQVTTERHHILVETPPILLLVEGDEPRLDQVFTNLITNAIKYSPTGGDIRMTVIPLESDPPPPERWVEIRIRDQGQGIAAHELERIFRRFERADDPQGQIQGLGLGLYIARAVIQAHGGTITAESPGLGQGSTFVVRLRRMARA